MRELAELLGKSGDWLVERVRESARERGYTSLTPVRRMSWEASVAGLSTAILQALETPEALEPELAPSTRAEVLEAFAVLEARRHRARGVTLGLFLGLLSCYSQAYQELAERTGPDEAARRFRMRFIGRVFERLTMAVAVDWDAVNESRRVEELRAESQRAQHERHRLAEVFQALPIPALLTDPEGRITGLNLTACSWLAKGLGSPPDPEGGRSPACKALIGQDVTLLLPWLAPALLRMRATRAESQEVLGAAPAPGEKLLHLDTRLHPLFDISGGFEGMVAVFQDVTALREANEAQARSAAELRDQLRDASSLNRLGEVLGRPAADLPELLRNVADALPWCWDRPQTLAAVLRFDDQEYQSSDGPRPESCSQTLAEPLTLLGQERGDLALCARPGSPAFRISDAALLADMARRLEHVLAIRASLSLVNRTERQFREFFDSAADAILIHDGTGRILDANRNAGIWLGASTESLRGQSLLDYVAETDREAAAGRFQNALRGEPELFQATLHRRDGFAIPTELLCQAQDYLDQPALVTSGRNITGRLRAQTEIERRLEMEALVAGISGRLINSEERALAGAIEDSLEDLCLFLGMQRAGVYLLDERKLGFNLVYRRGNPPKEVRPLRRIGPRGLPWFTERILAGERVFIRDAAHMPPAARKEKILLTGMGIASISAVPMTVKERLVGVLVVASATPLDTARLTGSRVLDQATLLLSIAIERHRTSQALRESEERFRIIVETAQEAVINLGTDSRISYANPRAVSLFGYGLEELLGKRILDVVDAQDHKLLLKNIERRKKGLADQYELRFRHKKGHRVWTMLSATPLAGPGGAYAGSVGMIADISDRVRAENRLRRNEARYRSLVESMHEGLIMAHSGGRIIYANDRFCAMLGRRRNEFTGRHVADFAEEDSRERITAMFTGGRQVEGSEEILWEHASGRHIYSLVSPSAYADEEGRTAGFFAVITDTTERKGLESQLLQSQKLEAIGQLAAGIAHEINTPAQYVGNNIQFIKGAFEDLLAVMASVRGFLDAARESCPTPEGIEALEQLLAERDIEYLSAEVPGAISQTLEGVERISTIVRSVKQFAHPGAAVMAPADLNESMRSTATVSRNEWKYVSDLDLDLDPALPLVVCMIGEINQVVLNLIINAAHAIADASKLDPERPGRITLSTRLAPPWAEIRVADSGTGIPAAVQAKIFDPFFTTKEVGRGTGQGLTISRSIVMDKHKGQLFFETREGAGTTFVVRLPLEQRQENMA